VLGVEELAAIYMSRAPSHLNTAVVDADANEGKNARLDARERHLWLMRKGGVLPPRLNEPQFPVFRAVRWGAESGHRSLAAAPSL
jgi:hypothetical protein